MVRNLTLCLNLSVIPFLVQILFGFHYPQYEDHPEITPTKTITDYKSYPPLGLLSKKRVDHQFGEFLQRRFNSLGSDGGLRKFQKATNSLRRNNIDKIEVGKETEGTNDCQIQSKKEKEDHRRSMVIHSNDIADDDLKTLDKQIEHLIRVRTVRRFQKVLGKFINDDYADSRVDDDINPENVGVSEASNYDGSDGSSEKEKYSEGNDNVNQKIH